MITKSVTLGLAAVTTLVCMTIPPVATAATKASAGDTRPKSSCAILLDSAPDLFEVEEKGSEFNFKGLSANGKKVLREEARKIKDINLIGNINLFEMEAFIKNFMIAGIARLNILAHGGPGGAKTLLAEVLTAKEDLHKVTGNAMQTEVPYIGGVVEAESMQGREVRNFEGSVVGTEKAFVNGDEIDKVNPGVQGVLLPILNEHEAHFGNQTIKARFRTFYATSNATLFNMIQNFIEKGEGSSGPAFLNRFHIKFHVPNWLDVKTLIKLKFLNGKRSFLRAISGSAPNALKDAVFKTPEKIDWVALQALADGIFEIGPELRSHMVYFARDFREATNKEIIKSELARDDNPKENPVVLTPSAELTTRLTTVDEPLIRASALLDLLLNTPPEKLNSMTKEKIVLSQLSAWRAYSLYTTVGPHDVWFDPWKRIIHFEAHQDNKGKIISDGVDKEIETAKSKIDQLEAKSRHDEQLRFHEKMTVYWQDAKWGAEQDARLKQASGQVDDSVFDAAGDFEFKMAKARGLKHAP